MWTELLTRLTTAMNAHDLAAFVDCFATNYHSEQPAHPDRRFTGREQVWQNWTAMFAGLPDFHAETLRANGDGDSLWVEWRWTGTRSDGTVLDARGICIFGIRDQRLAWGRLYMEDVEVGLGIQAAVESLSSARNNLQQPRDGRSRHHPTLSDHMNPIELLSSRRSIREFTPREVSRAEIEILLEHAVTAPNHRLTQPWKFFVLGPEARRAFGLALGARKARKVEDPIAAEQLRQKVGEEHALLPLMIVVAVSQNENPEIREEDYAAGMMAVQNIALAAVALGLGTHIKSGAVMNDPAARAAIGVAEGDRVIATINVGEPANIPVAKPRRSAADVTAWLP